MIKFVTRLKAGGTLSGAGDPDIILLLEETKKKSIPKLPMGGGGGGVINA
jgi:hypothetical protein